MKALLVFFGGLVVWGAVTGKSAGSGGPPTAATEIPTSGGHGALVGVLVVVGLLALVAKAGRGGRAATGAGIPNPRYTGSPSKAPAQMSPGQKRFNDNHEKRHRDKARQFGADGYWTYDADGGATFYQTNDSHLTPVQQAAIALAPSRGRRSSALQHSVDQKVAQQWIDQYPRDERRARMAEARRLAQ